MDKPKLGAQELGCRLVEQNVLMSFNRLVPDLEKLVNNVDSDVLQDCEVSQDDLLDLVGGNPDYEEAATQAGWIEAPYHEQLYDYVLLEFGGKWPDAGEHLTALGWEQVGDETIFRFRNRGYEPITFKVDDEEHVVGAGEDFDVLIQHQPGEDDEVDVLWKALAARLGITEFASDTYQIDGNDPWEDVCAYGRIDADDYRREVFEYWAVSDWLGRKLKERGEIVVELYGASVWGRCTTGQAILLDGVIRNIALETWPDEFSGNEY